MKRLMRVSFIVVILFILAFSIIELAASPATTFAPDAMPNVGWNSRATGFEWGLPQPNVGWNSKGVAFVLPNPQPCVGWNT